MLNYNIRNIHICTKLKLNCISKKKKQQLWKKKTKAKSINEHTKLLLPNLESRPESCNAMGG